MKTTLYIITALLLVGGAMALTLGPMTLEQLSSAQHDPKFYNEMGYALSQEGKMIAAEDAFSRAVVIDPSYDNARTNLYLAAFANENYDVAIEHARILHAQHASNAQYTFDLAQALVAHARTQEKDASAAVSDLEEAAALLESLGSYPHAQENARIIRTVLAEATA